MRRAIAAAALVAGAALATSPARANTFETLGHGAVRVAAEELAWALVAPCDRGDEVAQRQCRLLRDRKAKQLAGATLLVDGDRAALTLGTWDPQKRSVSLTLTACIACGGVTIDGQLWHLVGASSPPRVDGGKVVGFQIIDTAKTFSEQRTAQAWLDSLANARVQFLVRPPANPRWNVGGTNGLSLDVIGFRVYSPCDGGVAIANPPSQAATPDPKACVPAKPAKPAARP